jgi:hypothetical protein
MVTGYCEKLTGHLRKLHGQNSDFLILKEVVYITFSLIPSTEVVNYLRYYIEIHSLAWAVHI